MKIGTNDDLSEEYTYLYFQYDRRKGYKSPVIKVNYLKTDLKKKGIFVEGFLETGVFLDDFFMKKHFVVFEKLLNNRSEKIQKRNELNEICIVQELLFDCISNMEFRNFVMDEYFLSLLYQMRNITHFTLRNINTRCFLSCYFFFELLVYFDIIFTSDDYTDFDFYCLFRIADKLETLKLDGFRKLSRSKHIIFCRLRSLDLDFKTAISIDYKLFSRFKNYKYCDRIFSLIDIIIKKEIYLEINFPAFTFSSANNLSLNSIKFKNKYILRNLNKNLQFTKNSLWNIFTDIYFEEIDLKKSRDIIMRLKNIRHFSLKKYVYELKSHDISFRKKSRKEEETRKKRIYCLNFLKNTKKISFDFPLLKLSQSNHIFSFTNLEILEIHTIENIDDVIKKMESLNKIKTLEQLILSSVPMSKFKHSVYIDAIVLILKITDYAVLTGFMIGFDIYLNLK
ncbi:hypothetical protein CWI39_0084p0030 [Hamiltosporidium magnivora]|uniref:Uncharacterized protein n=1 Tax=Hamiltosporidium magnivora TaxID=148818 RepID=A0A4Q9LMG6_9MICR|nr:hypothetical protein CWI39_0084p0030 [Hamiltosporidium magnivora]